MQRLVAILVMALALGVPAQAGAAEWRPDARAASKYADARSGTVSFAVRTDGRLYTRAARRRIPIASVLKAMLMSAYLHRARSRPLGRGDRALLAPMIRWSDNATATRIRNLVGDAGLFGVARRSGMRCFQPTTPWGLSTTCPADQARFFYSLERRFPARHRRIAMRLLASIVPSQRWGIGRVRRPGWALYFKGGWGSGTGAVDHQVALLRRGGRRLSVAIFTESSPSHAYGKETLRGVAARLLRGLRPGSVPR